MLNNNSGNLPFWGKQKPLRHYFTNGSLSFSVKDNKLFCKVTITTKSQKYSLGTFEVKNKDHLDKLLELKSFLPTISGGFFV